jgi:WD40 repeat protein
VRGRLWEVPSCRCVAKAIDGVYFGSAAFSPDPEGRFLLVNNNGDAGLYDGRTLEPIRQFERFPGADVRAIAWHPDGRRVAAGGGTAGKGKQDGRVWAVRMWEADSGKFERDFVGHAAPVIALSFSADGKLLLTAAGDFYDDRDRTARLWDVETGRESNKLNAADFPHGLSCAALSPDGRVAVCGSLGVVYLWDLSRAEGAPKAVLREHAGAWLMRVAWAPDGSRFYSADAVGRIFVSDRSGKRVGACELPWIDYDVGRASVYDLAVASDGKHLLTANFNGTAYVLRLPLPAPPAK